MKALLLRVGIDTACGGCLAPLFPDGSFEYIPIPEDGPTAEQRTYAQLPARSGGTLAAFVPPRLRAVAPHFDPEFETFTYGDPGRVKRAQLAKLAPGDLLVFYAGLRPMEKREPPRLFIIGHFTVEQVHDFARLSAGERAVALQRLRNNAHAKRARLDEGLIIVEGCPERSRLLARAIPLSDTRRYMLPDLAPLTGYAGSLVRAVGHVVDEEHVEGFRKLLGRGDRTLSF